METYTYSNDQYYKLNLVGYRLETDEEYVKRVKQDEKMNAYQKERERLMYEKLKQKYEGK